MALSSSVAEAALARATEGNRSSPGGLSLVDCILKSSPCFVTTTSRRHRVSLDMRYLQEFAFAYLCCGRGQPHRSPTAQVPTRTAVWNFKSGSSLPPDHTGDHPHASTSPDKVALYFSDRNRQSARAPLLDDASE
jgi:hypothetical protein